MEYFVARQPVFNDNLEPIAYSLYYRDSSMNKAASDGDEATASVIINGSLMIGLDLLTDNTKAFIKFTESLLLKEAASILEPDKTVIDVLDPINDNSLLDAIQTLKKKGYTICIDAAQIDKSLPQMLDYIDIIKLDFSGKDDSNIKQFIVSYSAYDMQLMAYKVETREQHQFAIQSGFSWFQGNFFKKPDIISSRDVKTMKHSHLQLMKELYQPDPDLSKISAAISKDLGLTYRLLKLVNSAAFRSRYEITDIQQALVRLGMKEVYKWFGLMVLSDLSEDRPQIYATTSVIRAKALENLSPIITTGETKDELFMIGMFSMIDIILDKPMEVVMADLPLSDPVKDALRGNNNHLRHWLDFIVAYEEADWHKIDSLNLSDDPDLGKTVFKAYYDAVEWSSALMN